LNYNDKKLKEIAEFCCFLPYAVEDNIEKKTELNVVLNESLNTINKGNGNKVSSVGIIVFLVVLLLTESRFISRFIYRNVIPLCKLLIILCGFYKKNNNSYTARGKGVEFNCHIANQIHLRIDPIHKLNFCVLVMSLL
jgi:hypothetical protein